jgi:hypothetical protein
LAKGSSDEVLECDPPASSDDVARTPHTSTTYFGQEHAFTVDEYDDGEVRIS